tara:strand:+ start:40 stop:303 length:264 start_codon:yes stop_codon:yes gene_type:complete
MKNFGTIYICFSVIVLAWIVSLIFPSFWITAIQGAVFVLGWWIPCLFFFKWFPKFMKGIGVVIWTFVGVGFSIWLVGLVGEIFGVNQ